MIYEYAISSSLFNSEDRIALLATSIGMDHGRLVSDFPKDQWEQFVLGFIKANAQGDMQLKTWKECVFSLKKRAAIVRRQAAIWDKAKGWSENAVTEHQRQNFRAIVDEKPNPACAEVVPMGIPLATSALWAAEGDRHVDRKAAVMIDQAKSLLDVSGTIVLIDRNFCVDGRFTNVLTHLARHIVGGKHGAKVTQIKYVVSDAVYAAADMEQRLQAILPSLLPAGIAVKFFVKQKSLLHDRFILTDQGGLTFGEGLDEGHGQVLVKRLAYATWAKEWNNWNKDVYQSFEVKA